MSTGADMMLSTERESSAFDSAPDYPGLASPTHDQVCIVATTSHDAAHHLFFIFLLILFALLCTTHIPTLVLANGATNQKRASLGRKYPILFFSTLSRGWADFGVEISGEGVGAERSLRSWVSTRRVSCVLPGHDEGTKLSDDDDDGLDSSWWREGGSSCCTKGRTLATTERDG